MHKYGKYCVKCTEFIEDGSLYHFKVDLFWFFIPSPSWKKVFALCSANSRSLILILIVIEMFLKPAVLLHDTAILQLISGFLRIHEMEN